ncbi:NTE family protein [Mumia flava]|uniref:NTE family protein n=1 Tax=Mumia flava TaxID=1348852 RepID=A0A0B2BNT7_9ACTN|nr:patatin-like phospholipase family protein [Mumia flava]PJJ57250.1 NTE family protein [Mumia flava]
MTTRALVLGGGGTTGIAWEVGILAGLAECGVDLRDADLVVGTSAGSLVGAQVGAEADLDAMYERQLVGIPGERGAVIGARVSATWILSVLRSGRDTEALGRRLGRFALAARDGGRVPDVSERLAVIRSRLLSSTWPVGCDLRITAVDAVTGTFRTFGRDDGADLAEAVAASCAVPGVYPPVAIGGRDYIDGGTRSSANADLADGYDRVVALTPLSRAWPPSRGAVPQLDSTGARWALVAPDRASMQAIGHNVLDPAARPATARAARAQARSHVDEVAAVWD